MLVYTTLFTLADRSVRENKYVGLLYIWFSYIKKNAGLCRDDTLGVIIDQDTLDFLNSDANFSIITESCEFAMEFTVMPRPSNLAAGFAERYNRIHFDSLKSHRMNIHIDLDCLVLGALAPIFASVKKGLFLAPEGLLLGTDYGGHLIEKSPESENLPGFSAGLYGWTHCEEIFQMFDACIRGVRENSRDFYTVDQPFFNLQVFLRITGKVKTDLQMCILKPALIACNDFSKKDAVFMNMCGEPGNDSCHFFKCLAYLSRDFTGGL